MMTHVYLVSVGYRIVSAHLTQQEADTIAIAAQDETAHVFSLELGGPMCGGMVKFRIEKHRPSGDDYEYWDARITSDECCGWKRIDAHVEACIVPGMNRNDALRIAGAPMMWWS